MEKEFCNNCGNLIKVPLEGDDIRYSACCGRSLITTTSVSRPKTIAAKTGPMVPLPSPEWCPKLRGVTIEYVEDDVQKQHTAQKCLPLLPQKTTKMTTQVLTYTEKRERMKNLPKHLKWEELKEGEIYVIPKILYQSRKVIKIVIKTENLIRCSEIDEKGEESTILSSIYPTDIDSVFITKLLKY